MAKNLTSQSATVHAWGIIGEKGVKRERAEYIYAQISFLIFASLPRVETETVEDSQPPVPRLVGFFGVVVDPFQDGGSEEVEACSCIGDVEVAED